MSQMTNFLETALLNHYFRNTPFTKPTSLTVAYYDGSPAEDGTGTEVEPFGVGVRQAITFGNSTTRSSASATDVGPNNATTGGTADYIAIHLGTGGQEMLCYDVIVDNVTNQTPTPITFQTDQPIRIPAGQFVIDFPQELSAVFSKFLADDWLSFVFGSQPTSTVGATKFLSLHNAAPGEDGLTGEFQLADYARQSIAWGVPSAGANNRQQTQNTTQVDFTNLKAADTDIDWWGVFDALTNGNFLAMSDQTNQIISDGDNASAAIGALSLLAG